MKLGGEVKICLTVIFLVSFPAPRLAAVQEEMLLSSNMNAWRCRHLKEAGRCRVSFLHCYASPCLVHLCTWLCHPPRGTMSISTMPGNHPGCLFSLSSLSVLHIKSITKILLTLLMYEFSDVWTSLPIYSHNPGPSLWLMAAAFKHVFQLSNSLNKQPVWSVLNKINSYLCQCLSMAFRKKKKSTPFHKLQCSLWFSLANTTVPFTFTTLHVELHWNFEDSLFPLPSMLFPTLFMAGFLSLSGFSLNGSSSDRLSLTTQSEVIVLIVLSVKEPHSFSFTTLCNHNDVLTCWFQVSLIRL